MGTRRRPVTLIGAGGHRAVRHWDWYLAQRLPAGVSQRPGLQGALIEPEHGASRQALPAVLLMWTRTSASDCGMAAEGCALSGPDVFRSLSWQGGVGGVRRRVRFRGRGHRRRVRAALRRTSTRAAARGGMDSQLASASSFSSEKASPPRRKKRVMHSRRWRERAGSVWMRDLGASLRA